MNENTKTKRRFQFTLRRFLIFTAFAGVIFALVSREGIRYRQSTSVADSVRKLGGIVSWNDEIGENIIRDQTLSRITDVRFTNPVFDHGEWQVLADLPNGFGLHIDSMAFADDSLSPLVGIGTLDYLVLLNTKVSESAIIEFQRQRPDVTVMIDYPGDPGFREYRETAP